MDGELPCLVRLSGDELRDISSATLRHYQEGAGSFWSGTRDHDVSQNVEALIRHLPGPPPQVVLDLGCGPGRDLAVFRDLGYVAVGLDGAEAFVRMARDHSGCEVLHQDFLALDLEDARFDGVFANASLFHVPSQELPRVLGELWASLKPEGVLFSSNPHGPNREGWSGDRYGCYLDLGEWRRFLIAAGFVELEHYYRPPGQPRHRQPWLASVWRKQPGPSPSIRLTTAPAGHAAGATGGAATDAAAASAADAARHQAQQRPPSRAAAAVAAGSRRDSAESWPAQMAVVAARALRHAQTESQETA